MEKSSTIEISETSLSINFGENFALAQSTRSFFEYLLKFTYSSNENSFTHPKDINLPSKLTKSIKFLNRKNISYKLSSNAEKYNQEVLEEKDNFDNKIKKASEIKNHSFTDTSISGFNRILKNYQAKGYNHLISIENGANFSVPGSGKTTVSYAYYKYLLDNKVVEKMVVISPRSAFVPWEEEYSLCFQDKPVIKRVVGNIQARKKIYYSVEKYNILLITYQTAANDIDELINLCKRFKILVILDESHYIKRINKGFWSTQLLKLAQYPERKIILTGTPAPNSYEDLWTQVNFLWPNKNILGNQDSFKNLSSNKEKLEVVKEIIYPFFFRTTKKDLSLPKPIFEKIDIEMAPIQKRIYRALAIKFITELKEPPLDTLKLRQWRKAKIIRLIQTATNPSLLSRYSEEFRLPPLDSEGFSLTDLIEKYSDYELPPKYTVAMNEIKMCNKNNKKIIIWTSFIQNIKTLSKMLKDEGIPYTRVYGEVPKDFSDDEEDNREKEIQRFKTDKNITVLLANPAACSESISLHKICKEALYFDRSFNCGQYLQSLDRIHRLGLAENDEIKYKLLISKDTVDCVIDQRLTDKKRNMETLLSEDLPLGAFDTDPSDVIGNESEEIIDFNETMKDLEKKYKSEK